ncbi:MAG TPA: DegQ family serine endoprotease [Gammaproteobacteria bacterium]|nr:DegQ family serine endoprotease [Gammaproteobacteria bacterium]
MSEQWKKSSARFGWLAGAAGVGVLSFSLLTVNQHSSAQPAAPRAPAAVGVSFADVIESVSPAVVNISVMKVESAAPTSFQYSVPRGQGQLPFDEFFERFFDGERGGQMPERRSEGQGSGFLIDASGYIVTNNHVAGGADQITVTLQDGRKFEAKLVGNDPKTDLAVVKVEASGLPYVAFGDSDKARVGDWVVAIGNPFGLGGTATAGIVSARGRDINSGPYDDYLQLDAPINFGNSGGPVFNTAGEVVGVNTAIFSPNGGNIGIGFAIPANQAKEIVADLRENGSVERGWLGVQIQNVDEEIAKSLHLKGTEGALVADVVADGPAQHAGVQQGDVITKFNGRDVDSSRTLSRLVASASPNEKSKVTVWRDGRSHELTVDLGEAEQDEAVAATEPHGPAQSSAAVGMSLRPLTNDDRASLGLPSGVNGAIVASVQPGSAAAEKGIRPGDVITRVNQKAVTSVADAVAALNSARDRNETALLLVRRGDAQQFVALSFS